jgi:transcriptional regulator with XRE-family HTH domain
MARGAEIEAFGEKLRLATGRANLSRAQVAQLVGVDKSVVARWLSGALRPADHSLAALSAGLGRHIDGFTRADWELPAVAFAARLGVSAAAPKPMPGDDEAAQRPGSLTRFLAQCDRVAPREELPVAAERFAGLWLMLRRKQALVDAGVAEIWDGPTGLEFRVRDGSTPEGTIGPAFARGVNLWHLGIAPNRDYRPLALHLTGTVTPAAILDGLVLFPTGERADIPTACRIVGFRLGPREPDWNRGQARWTALVQPVLQQNRAGWAELLPPLVRDAFLQPEESAMIRLTADRNLAMSEEEIAQQDRDPRRQALREALSRLRRWHAEQAGDAA